MNVPPGAPPIGATVRLTDPDTGRQHAGVVLRYVVRGRRKGQALVRLGRSTQGRTVHVEPARLHRL